MSTNHRSLNRGSSGNADILVDAERACHEGLAVDPGNGLLHHSLGRTLYERHGGTEGALASFEAAVAYDSDQVWWSHLYRAHCLHDLERWSEAADAYRKVDRSRFVGPVSWRADLVIEQLAHCLYLAGETEESRVLFEAALASHEARPASLDATRYIEAASTFFPDELRPRIDALLKAQGFDSAVGRIAAESPRP